jgi:hypothetical protein
MDTGDILVRATVWLAVACYVAGPLGRISPAPAWRVVWSIGCVAFLAHVIAAFHVHYAWSHAVAIRETARQTAEVVGRAVGGGLWVNYLFVVLWCADAAWWWRAPASHRQRGLEVHVALHGFFVFVVFNGAVVFAAGPVRWLGLAVTVVAVAALGIAWQRRVPRAGAS